jgi:hypothetical protein
MKKIIIFSDNSYSLIKDSNVSKFEITKLYPDKSPDNGKIANETEIKELINKHEDIKIFMKEV